MERDGGEPAEVPSPVVVVAALVGAAAGAA